MTDVFIMTHPEFPKKELYATQRMVQITEEGPEEEIFGCVEKQISLKSASIADYESVPP